MTDANRVREHPGKPGIGLGYRTRHSDSVSDSGRRMTEDGGRMPIEFSSIRENPKQFRILDVAHSDTENGVNGWTRCICRLESSTIVEF